MKRALASLVAGALLTLNGAGAAQADTVVQVPLPGLLDGRTVSTLTGGKVVPWTMDSGVDGGGNGNGYMTQAASKSLGQNVKALPDDGKFAADARHPEIVLHYSNDADAASPQTHPVHGAMGFDFNVPVATYSKLFLIVTSAEGSSGLTVTFTYADASTEMVKLSVPDYFNDVSDPFFILYGNMAKWGKNGNVGEQNHHNLDGVEVHPAAGKMLTKVHVDKTAGGYLVFWGATGLATSAVVIPRRRHERRHRRRRGRRRRRGNGRGRRSGRRQRRGWRQRDRGRERQRGRRRRGGRERKRGHERLGGRERFGRDERHGRRQRERGRQRRSRRQRERGRQRWSSSDGGGCGCRASGAAAPSAAALLLAFAVGLTARRRRRR